MLTILKLHNRSILSTIPVWPYSVWYTLLVGFPDYSHFVCLFPRLAESVKDVSVSHELTEENLRFDLIPNISVLVL